MSSNSVFVLVDMDGVLCDFDLGFLEKFQKAYPGKPYISLKDRKTFYVAEQYKNELGMEMEAREIIDAKDFFLDLPPVEKAIRGIHALSQRKGVEVFICTSPLKKFRHCVPEKYEWVAKHLGPKFVSRIILTKDKTMVKGHFLIDDKPNITGFQKPSWMHLLFETHHNGHLLANNNQIKICGWADDALTKVIDEKIKEIRKVKEL